MSWGASKAALVGVLAGLLVVAAITMTALGADAKSSYESPYGFEPTWNAALRLVRVDNGWNVTEKDEAGGYLLFAHKSADRAKATPGSLELVRGQSADAPIRVVVQIPEMPPVSRASTYRRALREDAPRVRRPALAQSFPAQAPERPDGGPEAGESLPSKWAPVPGG